MNEKINMSSKTRIKWLDGVRALAVLSVVLCHCTEAIYKINAADMLKLSPLSETAAVVYFTAGRLGVPFFLMISGYLLLDRKYTSEDCIRFWKTRCLHLLVCTEIWIVIYRFFFSVLAGTVPDWKVLIGEMLFIRTASVSHMWYMPMILGMYILIPFAANALQTLDKRLTAAAAAVYSAFAFGYPMLVSLLDIFKADYGLSLQFSEGFSGGIYGIYLILGYLVKKGLLKNCKSYVLVTVSLISFLGTAAFQMWAFGRGYTFKLWYTFPLLGLAALLVFVWFSRIKEIPFYTVVRFVAGYSFAVYLIHNIFRRVLMEPVAGLGIARPAGVLLLSACVLVTSFAAVWLISRIPKAGKYILYTK